MLFKSFSEQRKLFFVWFSFKDKTDDRKTQKRAAAEGSYSKGLAKHIKKENSVFGHVLGFYTSESECKEGDSKEIKAESLEFAQCFSLKFNVMSYRRQVWKR